MKGDSKYTLEKKVVGRLPMDLAESKENDNTNLSKRLINLLLKIIIIMLCIFLFFGVYFCVLWWLTSDINSQQNENLIVVTKFRKSPNATLMPEDFEIVLRLRNKTRGHFVQRKKRQINEQFLKSNRRKYDQDEKVKKIIAEHKMLCNEKSHRDKCKELMEKLKLVTNDNYNHATERKKKSDNSGKKAYSNHRSDVSYESDSTSKRRYLKPLIVKPTNNHNKYYPHSPMNIIPAYSEQYHKERSARQLTDTCLLAKLMKQSYPHLHGVYDKPKFENHYPQIYSRQPAHTFVSHFHENISNENLQHPQDVEIEKLLHSKRDEASDEIPNITISENRCQKDEFSCDNGEACVEAKQWCDGIVHCADASDELRCSCKDRVDESRICDGYFDCPLGEDEMECFGCNENEFSCADEHQSPGMCFSQEKRCNNQADCPNFKDEMDCIMLSPKLHVKPLFAISHTEGVLKRNYQGVWYSVCSNPYMWAHDACRRETGLIIRPPVIQMVKVDPTLQIPYINMLPGGVMETTDSCFNSSAVYVTCPDLLCGTRMQTNSQILRENVAVENNIFGRNKRFLWRGNKYSNLFLDKSENVEHKRATDHFMNNSTRVDARGKRADSRVVGGRPSQPAAWPWAVALYRDGVFHCGGVILNQNWIMSAAHCVHQFWQHYYEIRVGTLRRLSFSPQEQNHRVSHVIVNQKYSQEDMKNDVSLLHVKPGIMFSRWVRPICLPSPEVAGFHWDSGPHAGTMCTAVGWGATIERGPDPDHLREVEVPITHCNHREDLAGNEICAGFVDGGKDACQGDSGGPLLCKNPTNAQQWYIAGIVSHGDGCGRKDEPGVYTRVSLFVSWIRHHISSKTLPSIQPKQECPGFRCDSGIAKCLPKKRMCDEIIDCLDGEDEINCDYKSTLRDANSSILNINDHKTHNSDIKSMDLTRSITGSSSLESLKDDNKNENDFITAESKITHNSIINGSEIQNSSKPGGNSEKSSESAETSTENVTNDPEQTASNENSEHLTAHSTAISSVQDAKLFQESASNEHFLSEQTTTEIIDYAEQSLNNDTNEISTFKNNLQSLTTTNSINLFDNEQFMETSTFPSSLNATDKLRLNNVESSDNACQFNDEKDNNCSNTGANHSDDITNTTNSESLRGDTVINKEENHLKDEDVSAKFNKEIPKIVSAKPRKTHIFPSEFECARIQQSIPYQQRCDQKADCEDGTDETGCTCTDYLATFESNLLCDGKIDCSDAQDEVDCFECETDQYLCKQDQLCIPFNFVCDGQRQCPSGEDEIDCLTLSNGKEVIEFNGKPEVSLQGYITWKRGNSWHILCKEMMSIDLQEKDANYVCRYMGFSSANRYALKYINIRESELLETDINRRNRRNVNGSRPVHVVYNNTDQGDSLPRNVIIREPEVIKEHCVPNITKTCMTMYVFCDHTLFTHFEVSDNIMSVTLAKSSAATPKENIWPWVAKLYVDGNYKCTGVLIDLSWVLISNSCLHKTVTSHNYISVVLGSQKTLNSIVGPYEQTYKVDAKKEFYRTKVTILHLIEPAKYSTMVKPMVISTPYTEDKNSTCIVVGQNRRSDLFTISLKENYNDCGINQRCFSFENNVDLCENRLFEESGAVIICHSKNGWYPAASYINKLACDSKRIVAYEIEHLKYEMKHIKDIAMSHLQELNDSDNCLGIRCPRGRCVELHDVCNGVPNCEDQRDESKDACQLKKSTCSDSPFQRGCECLSNELKCRNGRCIDKELFKNGHDDCGDGTDEPGNFRCSDYLSRVMPSRLCDGILNCKDRSDEDPSFCKCFAKQSFDCRGGHNSENNCVAMDMVCDGVRDCPNGADERQCLALHAHKEYPTGVGEVIKRSHGVWHSKCYQTQNHTKSELENICRELGFLSGHSKQLTALDNLRHPYNKIILDNFSDVTLNDKTTIKLRNTNLPIAKAVKETIENCYPLFIECL